MALVHATRKLQHYFQAHTVWVLIKYPLQSLLRRSDFTGRIAKWGTRLGAFNIRYKLRNSIKGQVLANFMAEFTLMLGALLAICQVTIKKWSVYMDGASNTRGSRIKVVLISPEGLRLEKSLRLGFRASNNEAEYEALIAGLRAVQKLGAKEVEVFDFKLVVSEIEGSFEVKDSRMSQYLKLFRVLRANFRKVNMVKEPKSQNSHADSLATLALSLDECIPQVIFVEILEQSSIEQSAVVVSASVSESSWLDPYIAFFSNGSLPTDAKEVENVRENVISLLAI